MPRRSGESLPEISRYEAARRLKAAIKASGLTIYKAADVSGISRRYMYDLTSAHRVPIWPKLLAIASVLHLDPAILFPELLPKGQYKQPILKVVTKQVVARKKRKPKAPRQPREFVPTAAEASGDLMSVTVERLGLPAELAARLLSSRPGPGPGPTR